MTFIPNNHLNKHGFFEVGEEKFYSKLDAILYSMDKNLPVTWNFNNDVYSQQDWTKEPTESIQEMYRRRAQAIRDKYDYVVVMFSGGSDSTTVLDSFLSNGIPVDEVVVNQWIKYHPEGADSFMNSEITYAALPYLAKNLPLNVKLRLDDVSDLQLDCVRDPEFRKRSYREVNNVHNTSMISIHYDLHRRHQEYIDLYNQGKSVVFVWGESKPKIDCDEHGKHYFYFEDHYAHAPQPRDQEEQDPNCNHEQFFDDPEHPEIKVKQCHLLLNNLRQIRHRRDIFLKAEDAWKKQKGPRGFDVAHPRTSMAITVWEDVKYCLDRNAFNCSIYPDWDFLTYHEDKGAARHPHPAHRWMEEVAGDAVKEWYRGYIETYSKLPDSWTKHYGSLAQGIKRLEIKYYLE